MTRPNALLCATGLAFALFASPAFAATPPEKPPAAEAAQPATPEQPQIEAPKTEVPKTEPNGSEPSKPEPPKAETPAPEQPAPAAGVTREGDDPDKAKLRALVRAQAIRDGLPPDVAEAVAEVESGFNTRAVGGVGEIGLMQVMPSTARMLGFSEPLPKLFEPETNVRYGVRYLTDAWKMTGEDICATVMKYRAGHGETRYSRKSVAYCVRVRELLAARGFKVTGVVPVATFGDAPGPGFGKGVRAGRGLAARRLANGRMRVVFNWRPVDAKRRALDKAGGAGLRIAN